MAISFDKGFELHAQGMLLRAKRAEVIAGNIANADTPQVIKLKEWIFKKRCNKQVNSNKLA